MQEVGSSVHGREKNKPFVYFCFPRFISGDVALFMCDESRNMDSCWTLSTSIVSFLSLSVVVFALYKTLKHLGVEKV